MKKSRPAARDISQKCAKLKNKGRLPAEISSWTRILKNKEMPSLLVNLFSKISLLNTLKNLKKSLRMQRDAILEPFQNRL